MVTWMSLTCSNLLAVRSLYTWGLTMKYLCMWILCLFLVMSIYTATIVALALVPLGIGFPMTHLVPYCCVSNYFSTLRSLLNTFIFQRKVSTCNLPMAIGFYIQPMLLYSWWSECRKRNGTGRILHLFTCPPLLILISTGFLFYYTIRFCHQLSTSCFSEEEQLWKQLDFEFES